MIAPLDWGLGHTTRCVPLIRQLLILGCEVIIASDGNQRAVLEGEFGRAVRFTNLSGYRLKYGRTSLETIFRIILQIPKMLIAINRENRWVSRYLGQHHVDAIISDNRWGFFSAGITSVFITHQLTIKTPFNAGIEKVVRRLNYRLISRFSECWVPDYADDNNLAGELSHPLVRPPVPVKYLGKLTRIIKEDQSKRQNGLLIILSGPEPQRSILEKLLLVQLAAFKGQAVLVRGLPRATETLLHNDANLVIHNYLPTKALAKAINASTIIISRSGYSTIMDLVGLNKKIIFIPTPGQSEQEYLARHLHGKKLCIHFLQSGFSLERALDEVNRFVPVPFQPAATTGLEHVAERFVAEVSASVPERDHR